MSGPVLSKQWSTNTLFDGMAHVNNDASLAAMTAEQEQLELELQALFALYSAAAIITHCYRHCRHQHHQPSTLCIVGVRI